MKQQYEKIKNVSKSHDITVDLNLPTNGKAYNDGYYINGLVLASAFPKGYDKGIKYIGDDYQKTSNIIDIKSIKESFIPLSSFTNHAGDDTKFIAVQDFKTFYDWYDSSNRDASLFSLNYPQNNDDTSRNFSLTMNRDYWFDVYTRAKDGNDFVRSEVKSELHTGDIFTLDKQYLVRDIAYLTNTSDNKIILSQLSTLFINQNTKEATFDLFKGKEWKDNNDSVRTILPSELAKLLGFSPYGKDKYIYIEDSNIEPHLVTSKPNSNIKAFYKQPLVNQIDYSWLYYTESTTEIKNSIKIKFSKGQSYNVPVAWAARQDVYTVYERKVYTTTYDAKNKNSWEGNYRAFIETLEESKDNDPQAKKLLNDISKFSYWYKNIYTENRKFNLDTTLLNDEAIRISEINPAFTPSELETTRVKLAPNEIQVGFKERDQEVKKSIIKDFETIKLLVKNYLLQKQNVELQDIYDQYKDTNLTTAQTINDLNTVLNDIVSKVEAVPNIPEGTFHIDKVEVSDRLAIPNYEDFKTNANNDPMTITAIEKIEGNLSNIQFKQLTNKNIREDMFSIIKEGALTIIKKKIYEKIKKDVGAENIGIKESMVIDVFDQKTKEKSVFHFIDLGDDKGSILGIPNNINKLVKETLNVDENKIINYSGNINHFFKTKQINPFVSKIILDQSTRNVIPDKNYIKPDFVYQDVRFKNRLTNTLNVYSSKKIYKLAHYVTNDMSDVANKIPASEFNKFANLGVTTLRSGEQNLILLEPIYNSNGQIEAWENVSLNEKVVSDKNIENNDVAKKLKNGIISVDDFYTFMIDNNLTLKTTLNPNGWVEKSSEFENVVYVPFGYSAPLTDVLNEAINQGTLKKVIENMEKNFLDSDLVKEGFITKDQVLALTHGADYGFTQNNFAKIFSSGSINFNILPKIILDALYDITHNAQGDYLSKIFVTFFTNIKNKISVHATLEAQREYIAAQIDKLFNVLELFDTMIPRDVFVPLKLVKYVKNPITFIDSIIGLINSIDFVKFTEFGQEYFKNAADQYEEVTETTADGKTITKKYKRNLSVYEMLIWFLQSINQDTLKKSLYEIIDNVNINYLFDFESEDSPLFNTYKNLAKVVKTIIKQINAYPNNSSLSYKNLLDGLKKLIQSFDINLFTEALKSKIQIKKFKEEREIWDSTLGKQVVDQLSLSSSLSNADFVYAALKALFTLPGSNKSIKQIIIDMFNISDKGKTIKINDDLYITIPLPDKDKLGIVELLDVNGEGSPFFKSALQMEKIYETVLMLVDKFDTVENYKIDYESTDYTSNVRKTLTFLLGLNDKKQYATKDEAYQTLKEWKTIFELLKRNNAKADLSDNLSLSDLTDFYIQYKSADSNPYWDALNLLLNNFITQEPKSIFERVGQSYGLYNVWLGIFNSNINATIEERKAFANGLLDIINKPENIASFNDLELFQPSAKNIVSYEKTKFGISRSLANPLAMRELFFAKDANGNYLNQDLNNLVNTYAQFKEYLKENEVSLTQAFALIAASEMYSNFNVLKDGVKEKGTTYQGYTLKYNNLDSTVLSIMINNIFANEAIIKHYPKFAKMLKTLFSYPDLTTLQIPSTPLFYYPTILLRAPQLAIWLLTDTNNLGSSPEDTPNSANLAYLLTNKVINFEALLAKGDDAVYEFINSILTVSNNVPTIEKDVVVTIAIDFDYFTTLHEKTLADRETYSPFGMNIVDILLRGIATTSGLNKLTSVLRFDQIGSYVVKANYAWLERNKKKIWKGSIPTTPSDMLQLIKNLPDEYKVNVNGSEFIIIGDDLTYDNIYPIIDEANLQLNPKNQAVLYVNNQGFDRVRQAYRGNLVKQYLLVHTPEEFLSKYVQDKKTRLRFDRSASRTENQLNVANPLDEYKKDLENFIQDQTKDKNGLQRVFLDTEIDPINPERGIRISAIKGIINALDYTSKVLLSILIALVTISIIFIIKRYISNKNKVIGILVAQGYTPFQIAMSMTVFAFFTILTGDVLGYLTGFLLQGSSIRILENYWTISIETLTFSWTSLIINILLPLAAMSILIIVVSLHSLRYKSIDLMSGITEVAIGEVHNKYKKLFKKSNVKTKFSASLTFNSAFKLTSFGISVVLASITTLFGIATFGVFDEAIQKTYENRDYKYKFDLYSPTREGGPLNPYSPDDLSNSLYVPIGHVSEANSYAADYFRPGISNEINVNNKNGTNVDEFTGHIVTQFSVNVKVETGVAIDPFTYVYNSLPDSQKSKIIKIRNSVGRLLEKTQDWTRWYVDEDYKKLNDGNDKDVQSEDAKNRFANTTPEDRHLLVENIDLVEMAKNPEHKAFFHYTPNYESPVNGKFSYVRWDDNKGQYISEAITTKAHRDEYREFLVNAYRKVTLDNKEKLEKDPKAEILNDYFISFGGLYLRKEYDEVYTYVEGGFAKDHKSNVELDASISNDNAENSSSNKKPKQTEETIKLYGYLPETKDIKVISAEGIDLLKEINDIYAKQNDDDPIPVIINQVAKRKYDFKIGSEFTIDVKNTIDRYKNKINQKLNHNFVKPNTIVKFKVVGVNPTYINNEFIIPKKAADKITGLDQLKYNPNYFGGQPFNGILSKHPLPQQLISSTSLYSLSGYYGSIDSFATNGITQENINDLFDGIFGSPTTVENGSNGALRLMGYSDYDIAKLLNDKYNGDPNNENDIKNNYNVARVAATKHIADFANVYNNKLFVPSAYTLESKDIEIGFTQTIAKTVQIVVTLITILSFIVAIVILIIISTILISENEKNIAIWSILGYTGKEKAKMFFSIYLPFIVSAILIALPIAYGLMAVFASFLTTAASIAIPLSLTATAVFGTFGVVFWAFTMTAILSWRSINKIKAIDLLKGK
ncbi:ABC transporter permease [Mycoplasma sp. Pen4]|uniref:ABC transporter permease n=1 Tax=Mycoplasma sp. Pen4 TaxID=640330 RepID=UPI001654B7AD|nr:ABC transporter permease [Mycoplasma sp. Pen4]QNM93646.1 ABC transporter permease [Mycoplasma sp. Pen4]